MKVSFGMKALSYCVGMCFIPSFLLSSGFAVLTINIIVNMFWQKIKLRTPLRGSAPILLDNYKIITLHAGVVA